MRGTREQRLRVSLPQAEGDGGRLGSPGRGARGEAAVAGEEQRTNGSDERLGEEYLGSR